MKKIFFAAIFFPSLLLQTQAQIAINNLGQVYTQNFDSLGTNSVNWTNEVTIPGWRFVQSTNAIDAGSITTATVTDGNLFLFFDGMAFNYGATGNPDRALGSAAGPILGLGATNEFFFGARFVNSTGNTITNVSVSYFGEQWRDQAATQQTLRFFHRVGGTDFLGDPNNVGWIATPTLDFTSLQNMNANMSLNGNAPANRTNIINNLSVTIAPNEEFWIRWSDTDDPGVNNDQLLGIDDLSITFTGIASGNTNNPPSPNTNNILNVSVELKKPNPAKKLKFAQKGFKVKAWLRSTNTLSKASFAAFGGSGTNAPTNLTFTDFGTFKILTKGKLFKKKGVNVLAKTKGKTNKAGIGIPAGSSPVTLVIKVDGLQGTNAASALVTNVFSDVIVK
ncbi:MAG: hypothetical protein K1X66_02100 [Verrucomicrobiae bacterium]|nr:hypothetical protein [Verrucomicrobiae bacterium]